jgi:hypothetical protein
MYGDGLAKIDIKRVSLEESTKVSEQQSTLAKPEILPKPSRVGKNKLRRSARPLKRLQALDIEVE